MRYDCWDESGCVVTFDAETSEDAAARYVAAGDWHPSPRTWWSHVTTRLHSGWDDATHILTIEGETIELGLQDGVLYTEVEWSEGLTADWELADDGTPLFQGRAPIAAYTFGERETETHRVPVEPIEPACDDPDGHAYVLDAVRGHGGGVTCTEVCSRCGLQMTTDTWAQDPTNGEQGLRSIEYRAADQDEIDARRDDE